MDRNGILHDTSTQRACSESVENLEIGYTGGELWSKQDENRKNVQITGFLRYMAIALSEQLCRKWKNGQHIDFSKNSEKWFKKIFFSSPPLSKFYKI